MCKLKEGIALSLFQMVAQDMRGLCNLLCRGVDVGPFEKGGSLSSDSDEITMSTGRGMV